MPKRDTRRRLERRKTPLKHIDVDRERLAWAAGFFDGEGSFYLSGRKVTAAIGQTDRRVLDRFRAVVQLGKVYGPYGPYGKKSLPNRRPAYHLHIYGFEQVQTLFALLWTWLGPIKRQQAMSVLYQGE